MRINLVQAIRTAATQNGVKFIQKERITEIKPCVGDYIIDDPLWKNPYEYKVNCVEISFEEDYCRVILDDYIVKTTEQIKKVHDLAINFHGWKNGGAVLG